jgi:ribosomal protein S18 acetylase RimI-like enzyme
MCMQSMREITTVSELRAVCDDDALVMWAAQDLRATRPSWRRARAWRRGDAVVVASPYLSCRDRLTVYGPVDDLAPLVRHVLAEVGPSFRPVGSAELMEELVRALPELTLVRTFGWMQTDRPPTRAASGTGPAATVRWLESRWAAPVAELLAEEFPRSHARPGLVGVRRWAGALTSDGVLAAVTADAWSTGSVGFLAGVAARAALRGQGYAGAVVRLVVDTLVAEHGRAALMVDTANKAAVALYRRCGMTWRTLAAAFVGSGQLAA